MGDQNMTKVGPVGKRVPFTEGVFNMLCLRTWDEKGRTEIAQIIINYNENLLYSIQFVYFEDGNLVFSDVFGQPSPSARSDVVKMNYPTEYITCVSGVYAPHNLLSIKFTTNEGIYGPFGKTTAARFNESDYKFSFGEGRVFGGFHGYAFSPLIGFSIGVYVKLITSTTTPKTKDRNADDA